MGDKTLGGAPLMVAAPLEIASVAVVGVSAAVEIPLGAASAPNCGI